MTFTDHDLDERLTRGLSTPAGAPPPLRTTPQRTQRRGAALTAAIVAAVALAAAAAAITGSDGDSSVASGPPAADRSDPTGLGLLLNDLDAARPPTWGSEVRPVGTDESTYFEIDFREGVDTGAGDPILATGEVRHPGTGTLQIPAGAELTPITTACGTCEATQWSTETSQRGFVVRTGDLEAIVAANGASPELLEAWLLDTAASASDL